MGVVFPGAVLAQVFVTGLGGAAALSNASAVSAAPVSASSYDSKVGGAANLGGGYQINDWFSLQGSYIWNRNRIVTSEVAGNVLRVSEETRVQHAIAADLLVYFRPRRSWVRPYLSAGPAWVHLDSVNKPGLRVAVGADLMTRSGWGFRYLFSEMISANPFASALQPAARTKLMNFQNLFGVIKVFGR